MGKKYSASLEKVERNKFYTLEEAIKAAKEIAWAKFDETVDLAVRLGVDPRHSDQMARDAGADFVGAEDLAEKISNGWLDFDFAVATPDLMALVGKLGKILGPRGLMPNPKLGTVTFEVGKAIRDIKLGKVEYRVDKTAIVHVPVGKVLST